MQNLSSTICIAYAFEKRLLELFLPNLMKILFKEFGPTLCIQFRKMTLEELVEAEAITSDGKILRNLTLEELIKVDPVMVEDKIAGIQNVIFVYIWSNGNWIRRIDIELNSQPEF